MLHLNIASGKPLSRTFRGTARPRGAESAGAARRSRPGRRRLAVAVIAAAIGLPCSLLTTVAPAQAYSSYITGRVTTQSGTPVAARVWAYSTTDSTVAEATLTDQDGTYALGPLDDGAYQVLFETAEARPGNNWAPQWFGGATTRAAATVVNVPDASSHVDGQLSPGGSVSGVVTASDKYPQHYVGSDLGPCGPFTPEIVVDDLQLHADTGRPHYQWVYPDASGRYTAVGLGTGPQRVKFTDEMGEYVPEWFNDAGTAKDSNAVTVEAGQETSGVDATLQAKKPHLWPVKGTGFSGSFRVGQTVTADNAVWNKRPGSVAVHWLIGGLSAPSTGRTRYVSKAAVGSRLYVVRYAYKSGFVKGCSTVWTPRVKRALSRTSASRTGHSVTITVRVTGLQASGVVRVRRGGSTIVTKKLSNGTAKVFVPGSVTRLSVAYPGNRWIAASTVSLR